MLKMPLEICENSMENSFKIRHLGNQGFSMMRKCVSENTVHSEKMMCITFLNRGKTATAKQRKIFEIRQHEFQ